MSVLNNLKESPLGLRGKQQPIRDGKLETKITAISDLGLDGKSPAEKYMDSAAAAETKANFSSDK